MSDEILHKSNRCHIYVCPNIKYSHLVKVIQRPKDIYTWYRLGFQIRFTKTIR